MTAPVSPAAAAARRMTSDSNAFSRQPNVMTSLSCMTLSPPSAGPCRTSPSKLSVAGPVMITWPSSRQAMSSVPPSSSTAARRSVSPRRWAATSAAQAPVPHARVIPAPRSHTRSRIVLATADFRNTDICAFRKERVMFECRPERREIDGVDVIHKKGRVRVADARADRLRQRTRCQVDPIGVHGARQRDLVPSRPRRSHIDRKRPVGPRLRFEQTRRGLDPHPGFPGLAVEQVGDAASSIAAGLGLAAIGIADAHQDLGRGMARRLEQDHLITSDAGPAICQPARGSGAERDRAAAKIEHDKIVAEPMHLEKRDFPHRAAYMAAADGSVQRRRDPAPDKRVLCVSSPYNAPHQSSRVWRPVCRASRSSP